MTQIDTWRMACYLAMNEAAEAKEAKEADMREAYYAGAWLAVKTYLMEVDKDKPEKERMSIDAIHAEAEGCQNHMQGDDTFGFYQGRE